MKIALVFPGQGSQSVGMGKDLHDGDLRPLYDEVDKIFAQYHQENYSQVLSNLVFQGPEDDLTQTVFTQPAILTMSMALASKLKAKISSGEMQKPDFVAGHSLGEFSALFMAGVLRFEDAAKLVIARAALMQEAPKGAMTAIVGMNDQDVKSFTEKAEGVSVANYNSPEQVVITGTKRVSIEYQMRLMNLLLLMIRKFVLLHLMSEVLFIPLLMQEPAQKFNELIDEMTFNDAEIPVGPKYYC
jgi:[acyl-carrier-protein] S-malonyltransferase